MEPTQSRKKGEGECWCSRIASPYPRASVERRALPCPSGNRDLTTTPVVCESPPQAQRGRLPLPRTAEAAPTCGRASSRQAQSRLIRLFWRERSMWLDAPRDCVDARARRVRRGGASAARALWCAACSTWRRGGDGDGERERRHSAALTRRVGRGVPHACLEGH